VPTRPSAATTKTAKATSSTPVTDSGICLQFVSWGRSPRCTSTARAAPTLYRGAALLLAIAGATALHLLRQRGDGAWESLWAEDGSVFVTDAHRDFTGTLFAQNGGYAHLVPRLIAGVSALFPVDRAAAAVAVGGSVVIALLAAFVFAASAEVLRSWAARLGLAAAVLLLPIPGDELYANTLTLHFYLLFACFWALVWQAETRGALAVRCAVVLAATLGDPLAVLLLPLAVVAPAMRRRRSSLAVSGVFLAGLATQLLIMTGGEMPERNWSFRLGDLPQIFALRVTGGLLVGDHFLGDLWLDYGHTFSYMALAVVAVILAVLLLRADRPTAAFALLAISYAGLFFCVQLVGRGTSGIAQHAGSFHLHHARYVLLPFLFLVTALLALIDRAPSRVWLRGAAAVWLVALIAVNYRIGPNDRSTGPRWQPEVSAARAACKRPHQVARILVAPAPPEVWFARIRCDRL
jgi:hypothetical protein